jgi:hypothetical protein
MKAKYYQIQNLLSIVGKLMQTSFDDYEEAAAIAEGAVKIEDSLKAFEKLKDGIVKSHKLDENSSEEQKIKADIEYGKLLNTNVSVDFPKIKKSTLKNIKITPLEVRIIQELSLIEEEVSKEVN